MVAQLGNFTEKKIIGLYTSSGRILGDVNRIWINHLKENRRGMSLPDRWCHGYTLAEVAQLNNESIWLRGKHLFLCWQHMIIRFALLIRRWKADDEKCSRAAQCLPLSPVLLAFNPDKCHLLGWTDIFILGVIGLPHIVICVIIIDKHTKTYRLRAGSECFLS